ncbi:hypothetical protein GF357_04125 [Candidatus Dojkabacteria bacterium]|nr:hypothetical protein [Candidatus Dojkabacteria bacterium]
MKVSRIFQVISAITIFFATTGLVKAQENLTTITYIPDDNYAYSSIEAIPADLQNSVKISVENDFGQIKFHEPVNLNNIPELESKIDNNITLKKNYLRINTDQFPEINIPAKVTFFNTILADPGESTIEELGYDIELSHQGKKEASEIKFMHKISEDNLVEHGDLFYMSPSTKAWLIAEITDWTGEYYLEPNMTVFGQVETTQSANFFSLSGTINDIESKVSVFFDNELIDTVEPLPNGVIFKNIELTNNVSKVKVIAQASSEAQQIETFDINYEHTPPSIWNKLGNIAQSILVFGIITVLLYGTLIGPRLKKMKNSDRA